MKIKNIYTVVHLKRQIIINLKKYVCLYFYGKIKNYILLIKLLNKYTME